MDLISLFKVHGFNGLIVGSLFWLIYFLLCQHRAERKEWLDAYKDMSAKSVSLLQENNAVLRGLAETMKEANMRYRKGE